MIKIFHHHLSKVFLVLFFIEYSLFFAAMYFGSRVRFIDSGSWYSNEHLILASFIFASILSLCLAAIGLYRRSLGRNDYELFARAAVAFSISTFLVVAVYYIFPKLMIGRSVLAYALVFAFLGMLICRFIFKKVVKKNVLKKNILVVGCGNNAKKILQNNKGYIHKGFQVVGCFATQNEEIVVDKNKVFNPKLKLIDIVNQCSIDEIVIALDDRRVGMPIDELLECKIAGTQIVDLLSFYERENAYVDLNNLQPSWIVFSDGFIKGGMVTTVKRLFDFIASFCLLMLTFPIMLLTALAISLESGFKAPIFYRQTRVGENNQSFNVLKFRSMRIDAEKQGIQFAKTGDDRITRVGRFIRKYRIDELPQIFNVFSGEMSFVGPRPERPEFVEGFNRSIPFYKERHCIKPGITGWAQLCYPYGENEHDAIQKLQYDLYYVKNYSLFLDLTIIIHTVEVVLWGKGAR